MTRFWMTCLVVGATVSGGPFGVAQEPPASGKSRLYVGVDPKATLSPPPPGKKVFGPELELCEASGGVLVGRTEKGVLLIDVPQADKAKAIQQAKDTKLTKHILDVQPATAGKSTPTKRLVVKYKAGGERPTDEQLAAAGLKLVKENKAASTLLVEAADGVSAETVRKLKGIESVTTASVERVMNVPTPVKEQPMATLVAKKDFKVAAVGAITDPYFTAGGLYGMTLTHISDAWMAGFRTSPVVVAVIDTGVDINHTDLKDNIWVNAAEKNGQAGLDDDNNGYTDDVNGYDFLEMTGKIADVVGHGTHCAGTIGALANGVGVVGVCHKVKIMPLRFMGPDGGSNFDAILCIDYAIANGAKVISASWGGYASDPDPELAAAIGRARAAGVLFVAAAGNDKFDNDGSTKHYPSSFIDQDNLVSVMAVDEAGNIDFPHWGSNWGKLTVHLAAPGEGIMSTVPGDQYTRYSGTSMATPHVAGAAALLYGHPSYATNDYKTKYRVVRQALLDNVRKDNTTTALKDKCVTEGVLDLRFLVPKNPNP